MIEEAWHERLSEHLRTHEQRYHALARRILRNPDAAEDATQAALAKAWQKRDTLRDADGLAGWLSRIVVNESLQRIRRAKTERLALARRPAKPNQRTPAQTIEHREAVMHALAQIDEPTRTIVVLRIMQGLSGNEVKTLIGCSASEVSRHLHKGLEQLRAVMV